MDIETLIARAEKASQAVYITMEPEVAGDISEILLALVVELRKARESDKIVRLARKVKEQRKTLRGLNRAITIARKCERDWFLASNYWKREATNNAEKVTALKASLAKTWRPRWSDIFPWLRKEEPSP